VFGFLANPGATRQEMNQAAAAAGMLLSTPGLDGHDQPGEFPVLP
jgi:hypothetical protein